MSIALLVSGEAQTGIFEKKVAGNLIIPRAYPFDLQKDENVETTIINRQIEISKKAEWVIDLVPAGERVIALSLGERALLRQRAIIYQLERADVVILVGKNSEWIGWRQGKDKIPAELSSIPPFLRGGRRIPRQLIIV